MLVITAVVQSSAADIEALKDALAEMETASRAEDGCHDYTFLQEVKLSFLTEAGTIVPAWSM